MAKKPTTNWFKRQFEKLKQKKPINLGKVKETYKGKPSTPKVTPKHTPQPKPKKPKATKYTPPVEAPRPEDKTNASEDFFADTVISNYRAEIFHFPSKAFPKLNAWLDRLLTQYSKTDVATMLQRGAEDGHVVTRQIAYDDTALDGYIADMLNYLPEMTEWEKSDIIDDFDNWVQDV